MNKIWWHVYIPNKEGFGFSSINGVIKDAPYGYNLTLVGQKLENTRDWFRKLNATVVKVCEQINKN